MTDIQNTLFSMKDDEYKAFSLNLCPGLDADTMIGVRLPQIKALAKTLRGTCEAERFMDDLPHSYFEEYHLHMFLIEQIKDYDVCIDRINSVLPYIDNWATCDHSTPTVLKKHPQKLAQSAIAWIQSGETYTIRYGIKRIMDVLLEEEFKLEYLDLVACVKSDEYYVNMMIAFFFATALAKQYDLTVGYLINRVLDKWTHNKTIQKAIESNRISDAQKEYLRTLKIK